MEGFGNSGASVMKKRRSTSSRRPRPDSQFVVEGRDGSSHSSTPSSDNGSKQSPDQSLGYASRTASVNNIEGTGNSRKIRKEERKYGDVSGFYGSGSGSKRSSEGVLAPANWKSSGNGGGDTGGSAENNKLRKVKLKVGGVTRTFHPKSSSENDGGGYNAKASGAADVSRHRQKLIVQDNSDEDHTSAEQGDSLQGGASARDFGGDLPRGMKEHSRGKLIEEDSYEKQAPISEPVRKSKRVPKKRVFDEGDRDDEIRYLEKLKTSKVSTETNSEFEENGGESVKKKNVSKVSKSKKVGYDLDDDYGSSRSGKEGRRKSRMGREDDSTEYAEEDEPGSDDVIDPRRKKQKKESVDTLTFTETRAEPLTTRQRALQSGKGSSPCESLVEFPNGLPPVPPRKQKEKLSEVEQQAKKAEAAQRRRMQVEKLARENEAEAIRKILGQDSNRKKKEDKLRKERDQLAQKRAAEHLVLASNSVRCVMGPTGTIVTFGEDVGLPSIFEPKQSSYPPPREKCAVPSCPNAYKYRDSKSNLPLCSLQCYKAVRESSQSISTC